ncbi:hypothetical protein Emed_000013 [Eimeria media]
MAAAEKRMRTDTAEEASSSRLQELSRAPPGHSAALLFVDSAPWASPGPPMLFPSAESSDCDLVVDLSLPSPPVRSPQAPLSAGPEEPPQVAGSEPSIAALPGPPPSPSPANDCDDPAPAVPHLRVPAISSRSYGLGPCPPTAELSGGYRDGVPVVVPLEELERDQFDLRPFLSESMIHLDDLGHPRFRSLLGERTLDSGDLRAHLDSSGAVLLWSCSVAGVEFVMSRVLPAEEKELRRLSRLFSKCRLHIVPGSRVVQKPGSPACAWSNKDWCIGCGG